MLVDMMHSTDVETSHQSAGVVANLAEAVENQSKMVEAGEAGRTTFPETLIYMSNPSPPLPSPGSVLRRPPLVNITVTSFEPTPFRFDPAFAFLSLSKGLLQHLKFIMRSKSVDVQREAVRGIANISAEYAFTAAIAGSGAIMSLVAMLSSPDFLCQR